MKHFKRLFSYLVALTMVLSLAAFAGVNVHAEEPTYKLTLTGTSEGHTYDVYKVFDGTLSVNTDKKKVLSDIKWADGVLEKKNVENSEKTIYVALAEKNSKFSGAATAKDVAEKLSGKEKDDALVKDFAQVVGQFLGTKFKSVSATKKSTSTEITGLTAGYYFVKDQDGSQNGKSDAYTRFIVQVVGDETATIKATVPTVTKNVKDTNDSAGTTSDWQDSADADIGDDVEYRLRGTMPSTIGDYDTYKYVFTDTMSKGLTYSATKEDNNTTVNNYTIKVYPNGDDENNKSKVIDITNAKKADGTYYFVNNGAGTSVTTDGVYKDGKEFTWTCRDLKAIPALKNDDGSSKLNANSVVTVEYKATLNENALLGSAGNPNKVDLTYSNNPNQGGEGDTGKTPEDKNIVFTYKVVVNKVDEDNNALAGAEFTLNKVKADKTTEVLKTFTFTGDKDKDPTTFTAKGLDDGTYVLKETKTPTGYNTIADQYFTITAEHSTPADEPALTSLSGNKLDGSAQTTITFSRDTKNEDALTTNVVNKKGSILPSTGGMGTTLLYVAGGILVACAAAYVIINRKKSAKK